MEDMADNVVSCVKKYKKTISREGNAVLAQKELLAQAGKADEVDVNKMDSTLEALAKKIKDIRDRVVAIETDVNMNIEDTRSRKRKHESRMDRKSEKRSNLKRKVKNLESDISDCEDQIKKYEKAATELNKHAQKVDEERKQKEEGFFTGIVASVAGLLLVPLTGLC